jgi:hypothetical protein
MVEPRVAIPLPHSLLRLSNRDQVIVLHQLPQNVAAMYRVDNQLRTHLTLPCALLADDYEGR